MAEYYRMHKRFKGLRPPLGSIGLVMPGMGTLNLFLHHIEALDTT